MASATDLDGYLRSLDMEARWSRFDRVGLQRIVQLINKTNQFNLTTRRTTEDAISDLIADPQALTLQIRLLDQFGDNGIIAVVSGRFETASTDMLIDTWLMSCRVLGRGLEQTTLNLIVTEFEALGCAPADRRVPAHRQERDGAATLRAAGLQSRRRAGRRGDAMGTGAGQLRAQAHFHPHRRRCMRLDRS